MIAKTPKPPYYAVIFTSVRTDGDSGYQTMSEKMLELANIQPGFLGVESARNEIGITVSYWESLEAIKAWKSNIDHLEAQKLGKEKWYEVYKVRIAKVERDYGLKD
ncbi:antibiotic biosynthesis monooxygenase family protein [Maribellus sediminis]|uniref:antibiotic biosynthesis monooxygenase family protein n=1 Tax=Maribellus sediminis TaxID=2696285 RepID=UPI0019825D5F|nr:antibiotic biosynthesis monooxygenase [Maribellus sediminis]